MRSGVFRPCAAIEEYQFAGSIFDVMITFVHFASTEAPLSSTVSGYLSRTRFRNASSCSPENSSMIRMSSPADGGAQGFLGRCEVDEGDHHVQYRPGELVLEAGSAWQEHAGAHRVPTPPLDVDPQPAHPRGMLRYCDTPPMALDDPEYEAWARQFYWLESAFHPSQ